MSFDFIILGATGMQGRIVSRDLLEEGYSVFLCGWENTGDKELVLHLLNRHKKKTTFRYVEARKIQTIIDAIKQSKSDVVINCMEGNWNYEVFYACTQLGVNCIDLGSEIPVTKKQFSLDKAMKKKNLIGITGIGSVPGIGNIMLRHASEKFDIINEISVGFAWDSNIKKFVVPFSIESVLEEFTDKAPIVKNRRYKYLTPLKNITTKYHRFIGREQEIFVRHPEPYTFLHYFKNKGVKNVKFYAGFPKHSFNMIVNLIELGFAEKKEINYFGLKIKPIDFLTQMLKDLEMPKGYKEKENLWLKVSGRKNGKKEVILMECLVPPLKGWESSGCNIDTGFPASILAQMVKKGIITERGCFSPEIGVPPALFFSELKKKRMKILENGRVINQ
ncbi:MAG: saccharopine dehydrogenase C-terminal domain-containing protein [Nanoarchaeota archaeon]